MGFESPAAEYVEQRLDPNAILMPRPENMIQIETPGGFVLVDCAARLRVGDNIAFQIEYYPRLGKIFSSYIVTQDGETIDGFDLEEFVVLGKVTAEVLAVYESYRPMI